MRIRKPINYKKERVLRSDILPFEIPITYSNRHFYDFLVSNGIEIKEKKIVWKKTDSVLEAVIKILFAFKNKRVVNNSIAFRKESEFETIPFSFKITHKENDFRMLTIIHPKNQLALVDFYQKYKELILYYCSLSHFSIRRPYKISRFIYYKDKTHYDNLAEDEKTATVEEYDKEYENLKTFFVYKDYSNVHKFYESYKYHYCEKKYNKLFKFDISKCFDSIYTHLISWALLNKEIVKDKRSESANTFPGKFDALMRSLNYGETNGIIIGPEFSRIFAELILQNVDQRVAASLKEEKILHKIDYEVFRYVDDYFVFYNKEEDKEDIIKAFRLELKEYRLYINDSKTLHYNKPIITEITIAKQKITELLNKYLSYQFEAKNRASDVPDANNAQQQESERKGSIYVNSDDLITKFKIIIKETGIDYKDILNYTLALIERKMRKIVLDYSSITHKKNAEKAFIKALLGTLDFLFFLYSVAPRVNTTIRLCRILRIQTEFLRNKDSVTNADLKHLVFKKIYDNIYFILHKNKNLEYAQVETLYLLIALRELGKEYWLSPKVLGSYFGIQEKEGRFNIDTTLNYFSIVVLLFYMNGKKRYNDIRVFLQEHIIKKYKKVSKDNISKHAELVFLFFDILTCPYVPDTFKRELLVLHDIIDVTLQTAIIRKRNYWFTKWTDFNFGDELDAKQSQEVY